MVARSFRLLCLASQALSPRPRRQSWLALPPSSEWPNEGCRPGWVGDPGQGCTKEPTGSAADTPAAKARWDEVLEQAIGAPPGRGGHSPLVLVK